MDVVPASSGGGGGEPKPGRQQRWLPFRLLPRVPLPGLPGIPRLPLPGLPGLRRGGGGGSGRQAAVGAATATATAAAGLALAPAADAGANVVATTASVAAPPPRPKLKPASDVVAGALARALSQSTIHPLDTLKVRLQTRPPPAAGAASAAPAAAGAVRGLSKFGQLVPPPGGAGGGQRQLAAMGASLASLYKGVVGAASGAGIAIGAYFACYGVACNLLATHSDLSLSAVAFLSGGAAAAGSSVVKVPLAVCIRSVQAGVYPNVFAAANSITAKAGPRGLFTGFFPTLLEDVPDMAVKFAAYESMRQLHSRANNGRVASPQEDFAMGAVAGALAAAATTPLDVIKTRMMCAAASRPTMVSAARDILAASGPKGFLAGIGARALSNGINSACFFLFFESIRSTFATHPPNAATLAALTAGARDWLDEAVCRAAAVPRNLALALALPPGGRARGRHHALGWATAGGGSGLALLAGADGGELALPSYAEEAEELLLAGGSPLVDADVPRRAGLGLSLLARASPLRLEDHSQIVMAMAALKGVDSGTRLEEE